MKKELTREIEKTIKQYNQRLDALYEQIVKWLEEENYKVKSGSKDKTNSEELSGTYPTKIYDIDINDGDYKLSLIPYGIWIVGAEGRVELKGHSGKESLIYLSKGGPVTRIKEKIGNYKRKPLGDNKKGWHWVDVRIKKKAAQLTKDVLLDLLERVN